MVYINESNLAYHLINNGTFTQTVNDDTLTITLDKAQNQVLVTVNDAAIESFVVKAGVIEQFEADKKADILYTAKSNYRLFIRKIADAIIGICRKQDLPFTGIMPL